MTIYRAYLLPGDRVAALEKLPDATGVIGVMDHDTWSDDNSAALDVLRRSWASFEMAEKEGLATAKGRRAVARVLDRGEAAGRDAFWSAVHWIPTTLCKLVVRWSTRKLRIRSNTTFVAWMRVMDRPKHRCLFPDPGDPDAPFLPMMGMKGKDGFLLRPPDQLPSFLHSPVVDLEQAVAETATLMKRWHHYVPTSFDPTDQDAHRTRVQKLLAHACRDGTSWWVSYCSEEDAIVE